MMRLKKVACVLFSFVLAFSMCPIAPASARADEGGATSGSALAAGSGKMLATQAEDGLSTQAEGDIPVSTMDELVRAIEAVETGKTIVLTAKIDTNGTLKIIRTGVSFTIDLAGFTINRGLTEQDDDNNGHVFDVNQGTLTIKDTVGGGKITGGYDENGGGFVIGGKGHLIVESGSITGNQAYNGGGIFVYGQLTMTGGSVSGNIGGDCGGIYNHGGTIDLNGVTIADNSTRGAGGAGLNNKGTATVTSCTISRNVADQGGGGIYNDGNLTLTDCTISDNTSKDNGGGMNTHNTATVNNCTFTNNSAAVDGGGIYAYGCTATFTGCTINNNKAEASGGAIRVYDGTVEFNHTTLNKNEATWYGGGIYINNDGTLKLLNSTSITENIGYHGGGGAYVESETAEVQVGSGVIVKDNKANNIYLRNGKTLNVVEPLAAGTAIGVSLENYGGTFTTGFNETSPDADPNSVFVAEPGYSIIRDASNGEAHVVTSDWINLQTLIDKTADGGELVLDRSWRAVDENVALAIPEGKRITIDLNGYTIDRHRSSYVSGGEVFTVEGELGIVDNSPDMKGVIRGGYGNAGGINILNGGKVKLHGGTIMGNHAQGGGGGVNVSAGGALETYGGAITGNTSDADGGGVYNSGTFTNAVCSISNNNAEASGGGVYNTGTATLDSGAISSNKANASGGGVYMAGGTLIANAGGTPVGISSNTAQGDGGGLYVSNGTTATFNAGSITNNSTGGNGGGAYLAEGGTLNFYDATMTGNYAAYDGGGVYNSKGAFNVKGAPQVTQNAASIGRNILLAQDSRVTIAEALSTAESGKAHLDVITLDSSKALTTGFTAKNCDITCFTTNDSDQNQLEKHDDGELYVKQGTGDMEARTWAELEDAVRNVPDGGTAVLKADVIADDDDIRILLGGGKHLTIDLNGYKVDRSLGNSGDDEGEDGHVFEVDGNATLTIKDTVGTGVITGGYADNGGGVYVHKGSTLNLQGGNLMGNRADEDGGGVYVRGTLNTSGGAIVRNAADDNGGGIYSEEDGSLDLTNAVIASNMSGNEGAGLDIRVETASIKGCAIRDNVANGDDGGGINVDRSDLLLTIENSDIIGNTTNGGHKGGGIFLNDGRIDVKRGSISNNRAQDGGGVYNNECAVVLKDTTLSGNSTYDHGGAGVSNHGSCQLYDCTFTDNAADGEGGAVYSAGDDYLKAENCTFDNNKSNNESGGAICTGHATTLTNCTFMNNSAHSNGGALCIHGDTTVDGGTISGNETTEYGGGIECNQDCTLRLVGTNSELAITGNTSSLGGSGVHVAYDTHYVSLAGKITIKDNDLDNDLYLNGDKCVDVVGALDGSQIRVVLERGTGAFTTNLKNYLAAGVDPATIFLAQTGQWVIPTSDNEAQLVASDWPMLQKLIDDTQQDGTLTLDRDWKAAPENVALQIVSGKNITIDLKGHTIDRARPDYQDEGQVFNVAGELTICDTSKGGNGKICGANGAGGGVVVQENATFNLQGGCIQDNHAKHGGGIRVKKGGNLSISGGTITNNTADADGGGVYVEEYSAWTGEASCDWFGGTITSNTAHGNGGGMWLGRNVNFQIGGNLNVSNNIASSGANLYQSAGTTLNVAQALDANSRIDLIAESPNRALTSGLTSTGSLANPLSVFTYDGAAGRLVLRDGELWVIQTEAAVEVSDWRALQDAINDEANRDKVIRLANDIKASDGDDRLLLNGKSVIVDLNSHTLNRNRSKSGKNGHVFEVLGASTLTIRDTAGAGRITGGYAQHGGAINIAGDSTCNVEGGTFTGNRASDEGGAFYVYGTLKMKGGVITQNTTDSGGGIFVDESGTIELENVVIVDNKAEKWGGGAINNKGNATLKNCTIKNNWADNEGGAIYNGEKQLTIEGCTITDNSSSGGGGLCCYGTVNISNTTISNNYGDDYGGGLYTRGVVNISDSHINNNTGKTDGGGIFNQGGMLTVTNTEFSGNTTEAGGGALNNKGTATLTKCTMENNHADSEGGCIYEGTDGATTIDGCTIQSNSCGKDGGGISACGTMSIANSTISKNTAEKGGGGVYSYGDTTIANTAVSENTAGETGGGLLSRKRSLTLDGATVTANTAESTGGGLMVEGDSGAVVLKGAVSFSDNTGSGDVFLSDGKVLTVGAPLATDAGKASVWVRTEKGIGDKGIGVVFTSGYSDFCAGTNPAEYFSSNDGFEVYLEGNEASMRSFTKDGKTFIDSGSQVNPDVGTLTGANWMSGISGERRLNEINMPGTHDSATARVVGNLTTGSTLWYIQLASPILDFGGTILSSIASLFGSSYPSIVNDAADYFSTFANCQTRYIDEQFVDGIRSIDLRCNTYKVDPGYPPQPKEDNGEDLYLCHGKTEKGGTFYAFDERVSTRLDPDFITFREVLQWTKSFLKEHPTECIMMNVQVESVDDVQDLGMARIKKHLHEELATQINPSTGKPYLYMQDGVFGKLYTEYPKLKDCRGQVVLNCGDGDAEILGGLKKGVGLDSVQGPDGDYTDNAEQKISNLRRFFADHGYNDLPASVREHINYLYSVGLNGTDSRSIPRITPLEIARDVLHVMFNKDDGLIVDRTGKYLGLINMDAETAKLSKIVWSSNFFNNLEYCNVTVKSGFGEEVVETSQVIYGTKITIPDCIYANPNSEGKYFQTWQGSMDNSVSGATWTSDPGEDFTITGDTTFTALWGEQNTPVSVVWRDAEDNDKLRPDNLSISYKGSDTPVVIVPTKNWKTKLPGNVAPADITVYWDRIGEDAKGTYACDIRKREGGIGIVIELTHTPQATVEAAGTVQWKDNDDADGKRPENVTVHLLADSRVIDSATATAENNWAWDFDERPVFVNGQEVKYSVEEDPVEGYKTYVNGFDITNALGGIKQSTHLSGMVFWTDDNNADHTRPRSVTINLLKNGEQIASQEVTKDGDGYWFVDFDVPGTYEDGSYSVTENAIKGYTAKVFPMDETGGTIVVSNVLEAHEHTFVTRTLNLLEPTCTTDGLKRTIEVCSECGEVRSDTEEVIAETGHDWGEWKTVKEATSTQPGSEQRVCKNDPSHVQTRVIPAKEHKHVLVAVPAKAATCTEDGVIEHYRCTGGDEPCGLCFRDAEGTEWIHEEATVAHATGHDWGEWTLTQEPTEVSFGIEKRVCAHDSSHVESRVVSKKDHEHGLVKVEAKAATCTEDGNIEYWKCTEGDDPCEMIFKNAAGTEWIHEEATVTHATGHDWGEWRITKPATESEVGEMVRVCHHDPSHTQTRIIPKAGHVHALERVAAKSATCTTDGNIEYWKCTGGANPCNLLFKDAAGTEWVHDEGVVVHALGHQWGEATYEWNSDNTKVTATHICLRDPSHSEQETVTTFRVTRTPATCTEAGETIILSQSFKSVGFLPQMKSLAIPATGHSWGAWNVIRPATEMSTGIERRTCRTCGTSQTRSISQRPHVHNLVHVPAKAATCTEDGNVEYWVCDTDEHAPAYFVPCKLRFLDEAGTKWVHEEGTVAHALGHAWGAWTKLDELQHTRVCAHNASEVQKTDHRWDAGKVTKAAKAYATGVRTFTCEDCKAKRTEIIPAKVAKGKRVKVKGNIYKVTRSTAKARTVTLVRAKRVKSGATFKVPTKVKLKGSLYKVTVVGPKAFKKSKAKKIVMGKNVTSVRKGSFVGEKRVRTLVIGAGVKKIAPKSFAKNKALRTLVVKTKLLKKSTVKRSLAGSKVTKVKVRVGSKAQNAKYKKYYKKIFKKSNSEKRVVVR